MVCGMVYDGAAWQMVSFPASLARDLSAPMSYYVSTTGNDNNDGLTAATAFRTINYALGQMNRWNNRGSQFNIYIADGTYEERVQAPVINGSGTCNIIGNENAPWNCVIWDHTGSSGQTACLNISGPNYSIRGLGFRSDYGAGLQLTGVGSCQFWNIDCQYCGRSHIQLQNAGECWAAAYIAGSFIRVSGSTGYHIEAIGGSYGTLTGPWPGIDLQIVAAITVSYWDVALFMGRIGETYHAITGKANVTSGYQYQATQNSIVWFSPGPPPGPQAGWTDTGGQYIG
jgi:hypothetical protein